MPKTTPLLTFIVLLACRPATQPATPPASTGQPAPAEAPSDTVTDESAPGSAVCWCCNAEGDAPAEGGTSLLGCDTLAGRAGQELFDDCAKPVRGCSEEVSCERSAEGWDCTLPPAAGE